MRRTFTAVVAGLVMSAMLLPTTALAGRGDHTTGPKLINGFQRHLLGLVESDPWLFDDGCVGGSGEHDPAYMTPPIADPPITTSACTMDRDAPLVIVAAGFTCWQAVLADAKAECETGWADPAQALLERSVVVDGRPLQPKRSRVSGTFTFPPGAILDPSEQTYPYYAITDAVTLHGLRPGVHTVFVSFRYADGFEAATTFTLTVTR